MKEMKKRIKALLTFAVTAALGTRSVFADAADPTIIETIKSDNDVVFILAVAVVVIIVAVILLVRSIRKRKEKASKENDRLS